MSTATDDAAPKRPPVPVLLWPAALVVLLLWPLLTRAGHPLARDLVFLERQPLSWGVLGLGDGSPRAVPLDAVVATLTGLVDGGVLARLLLPGLLLLAAVGVLRLLPGVGLPGLLVAGGVAVWNPFVVERLALGQWALLASYAALPWLLAAAGRDGRAGRSPLGPVLGWAALASVTPTGGVLAVTALGVRWALRGAGARGQLLVAVLLQAPWIVAGLVGTAARTSDPAGVAVFAPDSEGRWGPVVALLGLGGIWDSTSEPASRLTVLGPLTAAAVLLVLALGLPALWRRLPEAPVWTGLGVGGLALACLATTPAGGRLIELMVAHVPAAGLLRDTQKLLLPTALLVALAAGLVADRAHRALVRRLPGAAEVVVAALIPLVLAPVLLLPDGAALVWRTVDPVRVPASYAEVDRIVGDDDGYLVTLPWRAYRRFDWGHGLTSSDPATRALRARVVTNDDLQVGATLVRGEAVVASRVGALLDAGESPQRLGSLGVAWVLVHRDDAGGPDVDATGLREVYGDRHVTLFAVPGAEAAPVPSARARATLAGAYGLVLLLGVAALALRLTRRLKNGARTPVRVG